MTLSCSFLSSLALVLLTGLPRVGTSLWQVATPAYSDQPGYTVISAEGQTLHCYPITECFESWGENMYQEIMPHGVAVESEQMAYRILFNKTQAVDVYCKRTPRLELATSYWYPNDSLQAAHYGGAIFRAQETIGVGSVNYWRNGELRHFEETGERQLWIIRQTTDTAVIAVSDVDWTVPNENMDNPAKRLMSNFYAEYTMCAGHRDMKCDVKVDKPIKGLCTGVRTFPEDNLSLSESLPNGILLASWGKDTPEENAVKETVGLAVFIPKAYAGERVQNAQNNLCLLKSATPHFYLTCCGATKEDHPVATNATEWFEYVRQWAAALQ